MTERFLSLTVLLIIFTAPAYADSLYYAQKIGISYDKKSDAAGICAILQKNILAFSEGDTNILLYPGEKSDLETIGLKEINAGVMITLAKKGVNYKVSLYQTGDKTVLLDDTVEIGGKDIVSSVLTAARKLFDILKADFPLKKKEELKTVEVVKVGVSEFESAIPVFSVRLIPGFSAVSSGLGFSSNEIGTNLSGNGFSLQLEGIFSCLEWNAWLGAGMFHYGEYGDTYRFHTGAGYGIFGSLIILGLDADFFFSRFKPGGGQTVTPNINFPSADIFTFTIGPVFQFNITKTYYIQVSAGIPLGTASADLNFNQQGITNYKIKLTNPAGPPFLHFLFNFEVAPKWRIGLDYFMYSAGLDFDLQQDWINAGYDITGGTYIKAYKYSLTQIGLGIEYEL